MLGHTIKEWFFALRPWSFPASLTPVMATLGLLYWRSGAESISCNWLNGALAALGMVIFQAGANLISDYYDFKYLVDRKGGYGSRNLTDNLFTPVEILRYGFVVLSLGCILGLILLLRTDARLLYLGAAGICIALLYSFFKFNALGDVVIFIAFSILPILGTTFVVTGSFDSRNLILAIPIGLITVAILHANNWRDIGADSQANIKTLSTLIGSKASEILYIFEILFPFIWLGGAALAFNSIPTWCLLALASAPLAFKAVSVAVNRADDTAAICDLDVQTAQLQLVFGLTLTTSFLIAAWV